MIQPEIHLPTLPAEFPGFIEATFGPMRTDRRERVYQGLYILATSGLSLGIELRTVMGACIGLSPENGSLFRVFLEELPNLGLAIKSTPVYLGHSRLALLRLSELGRRYARALGWEPVQNEWEQLIERHSGLRYPRHTVGLLAFAMHARLRDWQVELLPEVNRYVKPDARVWRAGEPPVYVEFECRIRVRGYKWQKLARARKRVALATFNPNVRAGLVEEAKKVAPQGLAVDLVTLTSQGKGHGLGPLWVESWG